MTFLEIDENNDGSPTQPKMRIFHDENHNHLFGKSADDQFKSWAEKSQPGDVFCIHEGFHFMKLGATTYLQPT